MDIRTNALDRIEDVNEINPSPQFAVSPTEHRISDIGGETKGYLLELLDSTSEEEPMGTRVFERLGLTYAHKRWRDFDLFWVEGGDGAFAGALREWHHAHEMTGPAA